MSENVTRKLDAKEALKLMSIDQAEKVDKERKEAGRWPGSYNLKLLSDAVDSRRQFVEFEPNHMRFTIKYSSRWKAVFIKPANGQFVPCGWFSYDRLKQLIAMEGVE